MPRGLVYLGLKEGLRNRLALESLFLRRRIYDENKLK